MNRLRILHLEDDPMDAELIQLILAKDGLVCETLVVNSASEYLAALDVNSFDLILSDSSVPEFTGHAAFEIAKKSVLIYLLSWFLQIQIQKKPLLT
ncbi:hypothetical protein [Chlorogloeopsis fritschii]|uniref:hypothetical protein n=1 Tax=Chlorogloeopsis fritschii TaxID=1124 RepID=UPI0023F1BA2C|nr:hypothetical protein [Chlorogloeopsis fritschii]